MIKDDKDCLDILTQLCAVKGALNRIKERILAEFLQQSISRAVKAPKKEKLQRIDEILTLLKRIRKV
jgi:DNA-binding FrmR family transcriptional regulator